MRSPIILLLASASLLCALASGSAAAETATATPNPQAAARKDIVATEKPKYSHAKEEIIIRDFFQDRRDGVFLDVGCWHPLSDNNTYYLEEHLGWSGIAIDALPEMGRKWKRNRPRSRFFNYLVTDHAGTVDPFYRVEYTDISAIEKPAPARKLTSEEIQVPSMTLNKLLDDNKVSKIDFMSMDIEGAEPLALAGFDIERFKPELICIESKVKNRDFLMKYFADHGYERIERYLKYDVANWYFTPRAAR